MPSEYKLCKKCVESNTDGWSEWDDLMWHKANKHFCPCLKGSRNIYDELPENCYMNLEYIINRDI